MGSGFLIFRLLTSLIGQIVLTNIHTLRIQGRLPLADVLIEVIHVR